jgi:hypothetical protein
VQVPQRLTQPQKVQKKREFLFPVFLHTSGKTNPPKKQKPKKQNLQICGILHSNSIKKQLCEILQITTSEKMSYIQCCSGISGFGHPRRFLVSIFYILKSG